MSEQPLLLDDVLWEECEHIARRRGLLPPGPKPAHDPDDKRAIFRSLPNQDRWALCLSGGGIRSATFALGILQGLAQCGLLQRFDYLSTVSGGGYVGGWLTGWIQRHKDGLEGVVRGLVLPLEGKPEPSAIRHLRDHSNYLTPKLGALSADTWTLVSTYLRNLILHWLVLLPPLLLVLLTPKIGLQLLRSNTPEPPALIFGLILSGAAFVLWRLSRRPTGGPSPSPLPVAALLGALALLAIAVVLFVVAAPWLLEPEMPTASIPAMTGSTAWIAIGAGILMLLAGMIFIDWNRPSTRKRRDEQTVVLALFLMPLMTSAVLLPLGWAWMRPTEPPSWLMLAALGVALRLVSWWVPGLLPPHRAKAPDDSSRTTTGRVMRFVAAVVTGGMGGILVSQAAALSLGGESGPALFLAQPSLYACLAPPVLLAIFGLSEILFIGLASFWTEDEDREWWGRSGAWLLIAVMFWGGLRVVALFGPPLLAAGHGALSAALATGGIAGIVTAILGFSARTEDVKKSVDKIAGPRSLPELALTVLAPIFLVALFALLSLGMDVVLAGGEMHDSFVDQMTASEQVGLRTLLVAIVALLVITAATSMCVNVNKFSLHAMYRYRLIRAYLGASHKKRHPHPFTGFDDADNIPMHDIWPNPAAEDLAACDDDDATPQSPGGKPQPIHVINISLNLVSGRKLAWQQRKAESFTVSPLHCGSRELGYRRSESYGGINEGISLGTAVTISGAAASPNMGYHSSAVVTFIMSLFNVRLGWWLGNPGPKGARTYMESGPRFATAPLLAETFGMTNDENPHVHLSDGGHFENLGLYEMVLRRCRVIVVSDAACDPACGYQDLGNAIRKIRIDLGIEIKLDKLPMRPRQASPSFTGGGGPGSSCAIGRIKYPAGEKLAEGLLIYLKPGLYGGEPVDVLNYAAKNVTFPHESTGDQWFSEAQFESYRALGAHVVEKVFGPGPVANPDDLDGIEKIARKYAYPEQQF